MAKSGIVFCMTLVSLVGSVAVAGCRSTIAAATASPTALPVTAPATVTLPAATASPKPSPTATPFLPTTTPSVTPSATPTGFAPHTIGTLLPPSSQVIGLDNIEQLVEFGRWGQGRVGTVLHSPDGQFLAISGPLGVWVYTADTLQLLQRLDVGIDVGQIAFSPDGTLLALPTQAGLILVRTTDWATLRVIDTSATVAAFSPDGVIVASDDFSNGHDAVVQLWRVTDGQLQVSLVGALGWTDGLSFSPQGDTLAAAAANLAVWTLPDGQLLRSWSNLVSGGRYNAVSYSLDGNLIAAAGDGGLANYQVSTGRRVDWQEVHAGILEDVAFSPDGTFVAGVGNGIYIWEVTGVFVGEVWRKPSQLYSSVSWSMDGENVVVATWNDTVEQWGVSDRLAGPAISGFTSEVSALAWLPDGSALAAGYGDGTTRLQRVVDGSPLQSLDAGLGGVASLAVSPDGKQVAATYEGNQVILWDIVDGSVRHPISEVGYSRPSVAFSPLSDVVALKWFDTIQLWDPESWELHQELTRPNTVFAGLAISDDGQYLATGEYYGRVIVWEVATGETVWALGTNSRDLLMSVAFSPNGKWVAAAELFETIYIWDLSDGRRVMRVSEEPGRRLISADSTEDELSWSPDSHLLASGASDGSICIWSVPDGALVRRIQAHTGWVTALAFSPDGTWLASGSLDGTIRLWGIQ